MRTQQSGFTLIELVVVITILGILAAFALPRFAALEGDARAATVSGLEGSVRAASALAHSIALVRGITTQTAVPYGEGASVDILNGYAAGTLNGIAAIVDAADFTVSATGDVVTFEHPSAATPTQCAVEYDFTGAVPTISADTSAC